MSRRLLTCSLLSLAVGLAALPVTAEAAARRPDLRTVAVSAPATVQTGAVLTVQVTTRNAGKTTARASTTRVHLSADDKPGNDLAVATVKVRKLAKRKKRSSTVRLAVPAGAAAGAYRVLACADVKEKVKEAKERNNCRVARGVVSVRRPATPPPPPPPPGDIEFPLEPNPVSATVIELDASKKVTQSVDPEDPSSLTVSTTSTDGTSYTLRFPAESLLSPEKITMTPLASATLPLLSQGFRAGVRLEPEGLMLQAPAILTIRGTGLGPLAEQTPYVFHEDGEDFHQHPVAEPEPGDGADTLRMPLTHFSVAGVGGGTAADRGQLAQRPPVRTQGQLQSTIAGMVNGARGGGQLDAGAARGAIHSYYDNVVDGRLAAAESDAALAAGATAEAIALLRQLALLGEEDGPTHDKVMNRLKKIWDNFIEHWWQRCSQQHDLTAISTLMGVARQMLLLGFATEDQNKAFDYAQRCARFEVEIDSGLGYSRNFQPGGGSTVQNTGTLRLEATTEVPPSSAGVSALTYAEAALWQRVEGDGAWAEDNLVSTTGGSITADVLERANPIDPGPGGMSSLPVPYVRLLPGVGAGGAAHLPTEHLVKTSSLGGTPQQADTHFWMDSMLTWSHGYPLMWEYDLEQAAGDATLLDKVIEETFGTPSAITGQLSTHTTIKVTHTPDG